MMMEFPSRKHWRSRVLLTAAMLVGALISAPGASAAQNGASDAVVPPGQVQLDVLSVNGSGCPPGTAHVTSTDDNTGFQVSYSHYVARANGNADPTDFRKNCQIAIEVHIPQGFTFAVSRTDFAGYVNLPGGAWALQRSNYYFQGSPEDNYSDHTLQGPRYGRWHTSDVHAGLIYAACGAREVLNVNTELRVYEGASTPPSWISMAHTSMDVATLFQFSWKHC